MQSRAVEKDARLLTKTAPREAENRERVPLLTGGIHTEKSANELAPNEAVVMLGVHLVAGRLQVDTGYVPFSHDFLGAPQLEQQFVFADSTTLELLVTTLYVYKYDKTLAQWQLISFDPPRTTTAGYPAGTTIIALNSVAGLVVGVTVGVTLDNGVQLITVVDALPGGNQITLHDPVPVGRSVNNGAVVVIGVSLHGDPKLSQACYAFYPANAWVIFSNGIDPILYYDRATDTIKTLTGLPASTTCASMAVFHGMLLLGHLVEGGAHLPNRVRQSDIGDPQGWTPGVNGVAAIYDLLDTSDYILSLKTLGPWLICYRQTSVMRGSFIGALNEIIFWEYMSRQDGIQSQGAVADVGAAHIVVGTNNVYEYKGGYDLPPVGEPVFENFLAKDGDIYSPSRDTLFCLYVPTLREVWIFYAALKEPIVPGGPVTAPSYPNKMLRYDMATRSWQERVFADTFISGGMYTPTELTTWATALGRWNDIIWARSWDSQLSVSNVPNVFLGSPTNGQMYLYDFRAQTDRGVPISWEIVTRQWGDGGAFTRWERVVFVGTGDATVEFSEDEGETWALLGTLALGDVPAAQTLWHDRASTRFQLRLSGTDPSFQWRYADIYAEFESEW